MAETPSGPSRRLLMMSAAAAVLAACSPRRRGAPTAVADPATPRATTSPRGSALATPAPSSTPSPSPRRTEPAGPDIRSGPSTRRAVALTFHGAGDPADARRALKAFADARARMTVLAVGTWLQANPSLATAFVDGGHDLGNHTWTHPVLTQLGAAAADAEVARCAALLHRLTGSEGRWFRPSGTPTSTPTIRAAAGRSGYANCLSYDVDPLDYLDPGSATVTARVLAGARPGSIVSLHLNHPGTIVALPSILRGLAARRLDAVTVSELLGGASQ